MLTYDGKIAHSSRRENRQMELDLEPQVEVSSISIHEYESLVDHSATVLVLSTDNPQDGGLLHWRFVL